MKAEAEAVTGPKKPAQQRGCLKTGNFLHKVTILFGYESHGRAKLPLSRTIQSKLGSAGASPSRKGALHVNM
jgi:hypothetical protein